MSTWRWNPTRVLRDVRAFSTNSSTVLVETDLGEGYLKPMTAHAGPHPLACELVGTMFAEWLGLRVLDYGVIEVRDEFRPQLHNGHLASVGPAFITRAEGGNAWGGTAAELKRAENASAAALFVVFDTWTRNCDRYLPRENQPVRQNLGNVFLSHEGASAGKFVLKAIDHGCCFTCDGDLTVRNLQQKSDDRMYGLFPGFRPHARFETARAALDRLESLSRGTVEAIIDEVPREWDVSASARTAWCDWILTQARRVRTTVERELPPVDFTDDWSEEDRE
jgi:hypothetical protein